VEIILRVDRRRVTLSSLDEGISRRLIIIHTWRRYDGCFLRLARSMGGPKRYSSIAFRGGDGFREELNPSYGFTTKSAQVICPSGALLKGVSSPFCKNISLHPSGKSSLQIRPIPPHKRGVSWPSRNAGWVAVDAAALSARWDRRAGS
jgi:hypothetical protein